MKRQEITIVSHPVTMVHCSRRLNHDAITYHTNTHIKVRVCPKSSVWQIKCLLEVGDKSQGSNLEDNELMSSLNVTAPDKICRLCFLGNQDALNEAKLDFMLLLVS